MSVFLLGNDGTETAQFARQFAQDHLNMQIKVLNATTLDDLLPTMTAQTPIVVENGFNIGDRQQQLQEIIRERNMTVLMRDCEPNFLQGYLASNTQGQYVMVRNNSEQQTVIYAQEMSLLPRHIVIPRDPEPEVVNVNFVQNRGYSFSNELPGGSRVQGFFKLDITLFATKKPENKWIKFRLTDDVGIKSSMGYDSKCKRGFFNNKVEICIYPGDDTVNRTMSRLPAGWSRPQVQPQTLNSPTEYTTTTGWTVEAGGEGNQDGGNVSLKATYSETNQEKRSIQDFSIRNISDGAMTGWEFYFTNMERNKMRTKLGAVKPIPALASGTLHLNGEAIYKVPADFDAIQAFSVYFKASFASVPFGIGRHREILEFPPEADRIHTFNINMNTVQCN